jgi:hypothetical protein
MACDAKLLADAFWWNTCLFYGKNLGLTYFLFNRHKHTYFQVYVCLVFVCVCIYIYIYSPLGLLLGPPTGGGGGIGWILTNYTLYFNQFTCLTLLASDIVSIPLVIYLSI